MAAPTFAPALGAGIASSRRRGPTSPDSGYGSRIGAPPGAMFRADFIDRDRDGVDDRTQPGPGMARPSQGANFGGVRRGPSSGRSGKPPQSSLDKMARRKEFVTGRLQEGLDRSEGRAARAITRRKDQLQAKLDAGKIDQGQFDARLGRAEGRIEDRMDRRNAFLKDRMEKVEGFEGNRRDFRRMLGAGRREFRQDVRQDRKDAFQEKRQGLVDARKSGDLSKDQFKNKMGALKERRQDRMEDRKERRMERREDRKERRMEAKSKAMKKRAARKEMKKNRKGRGD